jgi:hypothetical protein
MRAARHFDVKPALVFAIILLTVANGVRADFQFGVPRNLGPVVNSAAFDGSPEISADGLTLYFDSNRAGGQGDVDIWMTTRTPGGDWGVPVPLPAPINTPYVDSAASLSADGLSLYFGSNRPGGYGSYDLYVATRKSKDAPWGPPVNLGPTVNGSSYDNHPSISADGLSLYFDSDRAGSLWYDIWVTKRATLNSPWQTPIHLGPAINDLSIKLCPFICNNNLVLFFDRRVVNREIWMARRPTPDASWQPAVPLDGPVNSTYWWDTDPSVAADGSMLYFGSYRPGGSGGQDLWEVPIFPVVDFNGDGAVAFKDFALLARWWRQSRLAVDIGPTPLGDGHVDLRDLTVLAGNWLADSRLTAHWKLDESAGSLARDSMGQYHVSVFAWVKGGAGGQVILSQASGANWLRVDAQGCLLTELKAAGRLYRDLTSATVVTDGAWHEVGLVWDGTKRLLFVDGTEVAQDTQPSLAGATAGLNIGTGATLAAGTFWSGRIDDVRLYNRVVKP